MELDFSSLISACAGGFAGAIAAVYFQHEKEKHDTYHGKHSALLRAQYHLISQIDGVWNLDNQFLKEHRDHQDRFIRVPYIIHALSPSQPDIDALIFIAEGDNPDLLFHIQKAFESFNVLLEMVRQRNEKILEVYTMEDPASNDRTLDPRILRRDLRRDEVILLKGTMDSVYDALDKADRKIKDTLDRLHTTITRDFPGLRSNRYERKN